MEFNVTILGSTSANPTKKRYPSAQVLNYNQRFFLIDCGEGTQKRLKQEGIGFNKISKIFISHLHGDHYLGLFGLFCTMSLNDRSTPLDIYAPSELEKLIRFQAKISVVQFSFTINFHPTQNKKKEELFEFSTLKVSSFPLDHRIPTTGFLFQEQNKPKKLRKDKMEEYQIPVHLRNGIKQGNPYEFVLGMIIPNDELTLPADPPRSYAYCSDTRPHEAYYPIIRGTTTLYHESTFLHELKDRAFETCHTTAKQAGKIAKEAKVEQLIIGHFSSRYHKLEPLLEEAKSEFSNTKLAIEGSIIDI